MAISANGAKMAYAVSNAQFAVDLAARTNWAIGTAPPAARPEMKFSADGRFLTYAAADASKTNQVYMFQYQVKTNLRSPAGLTRPWVEAAIRTPPRSAPMGVSSPIAVSQRTSCRRTPRVCRICFLYDRITGATTFLTFNPDVNAPVNSRSSHPYLSGGGQTLLFQSWASDLVPMDFNQSSDVFAVSLAAPTFVDSDGDGMDDAWEMQHFGLVARDGTGDFDGDGATDLFEFQTETTRTRCILSSTDN